MKIIIALDGSAASDLSIQEAVSRPWPANSEFCILSAVDPFFFLRSPLLLAEAKKATEDFLAQGAEKLSAVGWSVTTSVVVENPRNVIYKSAEDWNADLIILGSRGRSTIERLLLGSTAHAVLRHAHCSVELVRAPRSKPAVNATDMRILIPTDGSDSAQNALRSVAARPWPSGSQFKVISCPEYPVLLGEYPFAVLEHLSEIIKANEQRARETTDKSISFLQSSALNVQGEVTAPKDTPANAILSAAEDWQADLIAIGSHGRRGFDRVVLGSVSESVAMHARCSVEVIREVRTTK
jgi:nucleotide-binding universal stress UspA family protein